jgi:hypothetical protein
MVGLDISAEWAGSRRSIRDSAEHGQMSAEDAFRQAKQGEYYDPRSRGLGVFLMR